MDCSRLFIPQTEPIQVNEGPDLKAITVKSSAMHFDPSLGNSMHDLILADNNSGIDIPRNSGKAKMRGINGRFQSKRLSCSAPSNGKKKQVRKGTKGRSLKIIQKRKYSSRPDIIGKVH